MWWCTFSVSVYLLHWFLLIRYGRYVCRVRYGSPLFTSADNLSFTQSFTVHLCFELSLLTDQAKAPMQGECQTFNWQSSCYTICQLHHFPNIKIHGLGNQLVFSFLIHQENLLPNTLSKGFLTYYPKRVTFFLLLTSHDSFRFCANNKVTTTTNCIPFHSVSIYTKTCSFSFDLPYLC